MSRTEPHAVVLTYEEQCVIDVLRACSSTEAVRVFARHGAFGVRVEMPGNDGSWANALEMVLEELSQTKGWPDASST